MKEDLTQKEILLRLMDKVDIIDTKLERNTAIIEATHAHAEKTNGRVTKLEDQMDSVMVKTENLGVKVAAGVFVATIVTAELMRYLL